MNRTALLVLWMFAFALNAIAQPAKAGGGPTPCTILTKADIQTAVGAAPADGQPDPRNDRVCHFKLDAPNTVTIGLEAVTPVNNPDKALAELSKQKMEIQMVPGLGDRAFFVKTYGMNALSVYKGSKVVTVVVLLMSAPEAKQKEIAQKLARVALGRL